MSPASVFGIFTGVGGPPEVAAVLLLVEYEEKLEMRGARRWEPSKKNYCNQVKKWQVDRKAHVKQKSHSAEVLDIRAKQHHLTSPSQKNRTI